MFTLFNNTRKTISKLTNENHALNAMVVKNRCKINQLKDKIYQLTCRQYICNTYEANKYEIQVIQVMINELEAENEKTAKKITSNSAKIARLSK